ncbi:prolyl-tRNA synthetase associated domain-containing protein [Ruminococcaceae bacterium OttesenSCG-928-I18]|nr:prolyl-tRNA synthetase associated domain-containing protein [Ruminococcaceae bacterium OttesenSCG-928-I18]
MEQKQKVLDALGEMQIPYECVEHPAVYTIEEMQKLDFPQGAVIAKNLFLRDAKGKRHFLVVVGSEQAINLKEMEGKLGSTKLSFASDERLGKYLGLTKGAVSPFGLLNDPEGKVEFYLDDTLLKEDKVGIHPNDNTATVFISGPDIVKFAASTGHKTNPLRLK